MVRRSGDCIMIAATLRHTAAAAAKVKSEIHMATDSLFLLSLRLILLERAVNADALRSVPGTLGNFSVL